MSKEETLREFIKFYNLRDVKGCSQFLAEDFELRSSFVLHIYPDSKGILKGKEVVKKYLELLFKQLPDLEVSEFILENMGDYYVAKGDNDKATMNYYVHYYLNDDNLIYLIKSNLTSTSVS